MHLALLVNERHQPMIIGQTFAALTLVHSPLGMSSNPPCIPPVFELLIRAQRYGFAPTTPTINPAGFCCRWHLAVTGSLAFFFFSLLATQIQIPLSTSRSRRATRGRGRGPSQPGWDQFPCFLRISNSRVRSPSPSRFPTSLDAPYFIYPS
ncbi:hypothetical protein FRC08_002122 [Ceratobasidium sp. 394]|nr:hypothetical protein FRC08_002122 [Ceratobasidium sp. 394]